MAHTNEWVCKGQLSTTQALRPLQPLDTKTQKSSEKMGKYSRPNADAQTSGR